MTNLQSVKRAAAKAAVSHAALQDAIRVAHKSGESLRAIAGAAGISHEQVRRIVG